MASSNGKHPGFDEDETPVERPRRKLREHLVIPPNPPPRLVVEPPVRTDPPTKRFIADAWKTTVVSCWALTVVCILAAIQHWPYEVTLGAIGTITGVWTVGRLLGRS